MRRNERGKFECPTCGREFCARKFALDCRDSHGGVSLYDEAQSLRGCNAEKYL